MTAWPVSMLVVPLRHRGILGGELGQDSLLLFHLRADLPRILARRKGGCGELAVTIGNGGSATEFKSTPRAHAHGQQVQLGDWFARFLIDHRSEEHTPETQ